MLRIVHKSDRTRVTSAATISVIGATELLPQEVDTPTAGPWTRALALAEANARGLAAALEAELGEIHTIEQHPSSSDSRLVLTASFRLRLIGVEDEGVGTEPAPASDDVLRYVADEYQPLYAAFRERVLAIEPPLTPVAAPLRKGTKRYEGFRLRSRNLIYASFRKRGVRLSFELPKGHGLPADQYVTRGRRDWRVVVLTSPTQLEGAVSLAADTVRAFST